MINQKTNDEWWQELEAELAAEKAAGGDGKLIPASKKNTLSESSGADDGVFYNSQMFYDSDMREH